MKAMRLAVPALVLAIGLGGCATSTPYQQAAQGRYGYAEQALEDDRFRVSFSGNSLTSRETVENYLLYRAAELTLANGYDHFVIVDRDVERHTFYYSTFDGFNSFYFGCLICDHRRGFYGGFGTTTAQPVDRYEAFADIVLRKGAKPPDDPDAYDARSVLERLGTSVVRAGPD